MLMEEFLRPMKEIEEKKVIVPIEQFMNVISIKTGWTNEELKTKDIGDIEKKLNIPATRPNNLLSIKRGKSRSPLYRFVSQEKRNKSRDLVTKILNE